MGHVDENEENCVIIKTPEKVKSKIEPVSILVPRDDLIKISWRGSVNINLPTKNL